MGSLILMLLMSVNVRVLCLTLEGLVVLFVFGCRNKLVSCRAEDVTRLPADLKFLQQPPPHPFVPQRSSSLLEYYRQLCIIILNTAIDYYIESITLVSYK